MAMTYRFRDLQELASYVASLGNNHPVPRNKTEARAYMLEAYCFQVAADVIRASTVGEVQ